MKAVEIQNISLRTHSSNGRTHIEFVDSLGDRRLGRILPTGIPVKYLRNLYSLIGTSAAILIPDGLSELPDGSRCLSIRTNSLQPLERGQRLTKLIKPLRVLHESGMNHLSIDEYSFRQREGNISLVFWGDGLLTVHPDAPCEVRSGGIPSAISDLYMLASTALKMNWLSDPTELEDAESLCSNCSVERLRAAEKYGYLPGTDPNHVLAPALGVTVIQGGSWQTRDLYVNQLISIAAQKGWVCRVIRCAPGEHKRPLPDVPAGTVTRSPRQLLGNAFTSLSGIEKLLIVNDLSEDQEDFTALLREMTRLIPSGLRLVLCGASVREFFPGEKITLNGLVTSAVDLPLCEIPDNIRVLCAGPSWYGPRCRIPAEDVTNIKKPAFSRKTLFEEGAFRYTAALPGTNKDDRKAESLFTLGRFTEALHFVSNQNDALRSRILMALGRFQEASDRLSGTGETFLLAEAYLGQGKIKSALDVLKDTSDPKALPLMAKLYDLSGSPASALQPLRSGLNKTIGGERVNIYCALRSLEMRLGMYEDALKHAEAAVTLARELSSVSHLVESLQ
ncbi:MAG: hypothetical protein KAH31_10465, partial [Candidatus Sabulitectum sp.]|nr:hypothetical protein [Candidatus Sabulitectum sp.]